MIGTIESRKVVTLELERSEIHNLLQGVEMRGNVQVRHKGDDVPVDVVIVCNNPETPVGIEDDDE